MGRKYRLVMVKNVIPTVETEQTSALVKTVHVEDRGNEIDDNNVNSGEKVGPI
jgi:hypothetical protein